MNNKLKKQGGKWAAFGMDDDGKFTVQLCEWTSDKTAALSAKAEDEPRPDVSIEIEDADPTDSPIDALPDVRVTVDGEDVEGVLAETSDEGEPDDPTDEESDGEEEAPKRRRKKSDD